MKQKISCHKGKCFEEKEGKTVFFDEMFENGNIVDDIKKEMYNNSY
jgi:hypothetical protein